MSSQEVSYYRLIYKITMLPEHIRKHIICLASNSIYDDCEPKYIMAYHGLNYRPLAHSVKYLRDLSEEDVTYLTLLGFRLGPAYLIPELDAIIKENKIEFYASFPWKSSRSYRYVDN